MNDQLELVSKVCTYKYKLSPAQVLSASKAVPDPGGVFPCMLLGNHLAYEISSAMDAHVAFDGFKFTMKISCLEEQIHEIVNRIEQALGV